MKSHRRSGCETPRKTTVNRRRNAPVGTSRTSSRSPTPGCPAYQWMRAKVIPARSIDRRKRPRFHTTNRSVTTYSAPMCQICGAMRIASAKVAHHAANITMPPIGRCSVDAVATDIAVEIADVTSRPQVIAPCARVGTMTREVPRQSTLSRKTESRSIRFEAYKSGASRFRRPASAVHWTCVPRNVAARTVTCKGRVTIGRTIRP